MQDFDIVVVGAGIAGASVAARLAVQGKRVCLLEMESQPGYHTTGRSAAVFAPSYGPGPIRALTRASEAFFQDPPSGFSDSPLFSPRPILMIARPDQDTALDALLSEVASKDTEVLDARGVQAANPLVRDGYANAGMLDHAGQDIDVTALHQGFLRQFRSAGGQVLTKAELRGLARNGRWTLDTAAGEISAEIVVNAAGAWADQVGQLAGVDPIGLTPKRRTAAMIAAPEGPDLSAAPITVDVEEQFYLKPDAGRLLISPADETPSPPCDAQPEELDIALCVDRIETAFSVQVRRIESKWAGLRSFVADKCPVVGYSQHAPGFFWLAGQGGYGIQTAPALSDLACALILQQAVPDYIAEEGLAVSDLSPARDVLATTSK